MTPCPPTTTTMGRWQINSNQYQFSDTNQENNQKCSSDHYNPKTNDSPWLDEKTTSTSKPV